MEGLITTAIEQQLLTNGYDSFSVADKNALIVLLANRDGVEYSQITREYILSHHKNLKTTILANDCEEAIVKGFTATNGHFYRTNRDDQLNMIGQKDELVEDETITEVEWKTEDTGTWTTHTREEWLTVYKEAFSHKKTQLKKSAYLKQMVADAVGHSELVSIYWGMSTPMEESAPAEEPVATETPVEEPVTEPTQPTEEPTTEPTI